jgi:hypothetical protein
MFIQRLPRSLLPLIATCGFILTASFSAAQGGQVTVPDVTGLALPQAAALLNGSGLALGAETSIPWTAESGLAQHAVSTQAPLPGATVAYGSAVDLTILRTANVDLLYDDNDLTLINRTGQVINLAGVAFSVVEGSAPGYFSATRWSDILRVNQCTQVWSVGRNGFKPLPECEYIQNWLYTGNQGEHFWTAANGVTRFAVLQDGVERAACQAASVPESPLTCSFYLAVDSTAGDATPYVYFAYTPDRLIVHNPSADRWMPLGGITITNQAPPVAGSAFAFGDPAVFGNPEVIGRINVLAPGQCLLYTNSAPGTDTPPEDCAVVARLDLDPGVNFWAQAFDVNSVSDDLPHACPAATADHLTVCIMPR